MPEEITMPQTSLKLCPVHLQADAGDPPRCLQCEPNQREAEWLRKTLTAEEVEKLTEEDAEVFFRHMDMLHARQCAERN